MKKHAYLIVAHNEFELLAKLVRLLDNPRNDIYLHIDSKVKKFDFDGFRSNISKSNLYYVKRRNVQWGAFSFSLSELQLFKEAYEKGEYEYYHLLSGCDLPIKSQKYIHDFFDKHPNTEFIDYVDRTRLENMNVNNDRVERFKLYHFFNNIGINKRGIGRLNNICLKIQKVLKVDRYKNKFEYGFGSNWCSLSHNGVKTLMENEKWIKKTFHFTHCSDELYKQTVLLKNPNLNISEKGNMRLIIWGKDDNSRHPHTFTVADKEILENSECLFARKFSAKVDERIVDEIIKYVSETC